MINKDELKLLCDLSRLSLSDEELEKYAGEMADIMNLMDTIGDSDFEYNLIEPENAVPFTSLRADEAVTFPSMDKIIKNGPEVIENMFVVPKVVD